MYHLQKILEELCVILDLLLLHIIALRHPDRFL